MNIPIERTVLPKAKYEDESKLGFGSVFTDHMFIANHDGEHGWHDARIIPYQPLTIDPASPVLHYSIEIFEGLKAYRYDDGEVGLFRPEENAARMNRSAYRMCLPPIDEELQLAAIEALVDLERGWVPRSPGTTLYLRPTMIGDGNRLGVHSAQKHIYFIICSPSGSFYPNGITPVRIHIEDAYVRAVRGGTGNAKTGGNYASSLRAAEIARAKGYDQVLWLDGRENRYIEEVGAMNTMFVIDGTLVTPAINGSILEGITRMSVLELAEDFGIKTVERAIPVEELFEAHRAGVLTEAFGTGTAAVISPIGELEYKGESIDLGESIGPVAQRMYDTLTGIQTGRLPDSRGWTRLVKRKAD
ncbi:MAG TPA: branched-chain amino acid aminotransferase [Clostridia bacterium]|nr:branched-chain amino acid aminotransferase [Clostridia bacterium]